MFKNQKLTVLAVALTALTVTLFSCQKNNSDISDEEIALPSKFSNVEKSLVQKFVLSTEFNREKTKSLTAYGSVDFTKTTIEYVDGNKSKPIINLTFVNGKVVTALLQIVPIPEKFEDVLPNDDKYAMLLLDYSKFDFAVNTGSYSFVDLNYDDAKAIEATMIDNKVTNVLQFDLPNDIKQKYPNLKTKEELGNPIFQTQGAASLTHFCDQNGNGNVSYFECLGCMISSCGGNFECAGLCGGIELVRPGYCVGSMAAACVYIAVAY